MLKRTRMLAIASVATALIIAVVGLYFLTGSGPGSAKADTPFKPHALTGMSDQAKAQYALDFVQATYTNGVTPKIRFAKTLTPAQMYDLGLDQPASPYVEKETPMYTVILQGEFSLAQPGGSALPGAEKTAGKSFPFMALSFDGTAGGPAVLTASPDGSLFKQALNDQSLPDYRFPRHSRMEDKLKWYDEHPCPAPSDPAHDPAPVCELMPPSFTASPSSASQ